MKSESVNLEEKNEEHVESFGGKKEKKKNAIIALYQQLKKNKKEFPITCLN